MSKPTSRYAPVAQDQRPWSQPWRWTWSSLAVAAFFIAGVGLFLWAAVAEFAWVR